MNKPTTQELSEQIADLNRQVFVEARRLAGHTQTQAGAAVHAALRTVQQWEGGERAVPKAALELYLLKTGQHPEEKISKKPTRHAQ
ncbi:MAG: hypothetical protein RJA63_22 [Pseudomonadota bacterium]|jgi:DNA-binding transcriptional regulator YiaG